MEHVLMIVHVMNLIHILLEKTLVRSMFAKNVVLSGKHVRAKTKSFARVDKKWSLKNFKIYHSEVIMQYPKKAPKKVDLSVEEYREMMSKNPKMIPKKSDLLPPKSKTMKSLVSEDMLQKATNELIELKRWWFIRFENWFLRWMRHEAPVQYSKHFFGQVAGKFPDNLIMVELGHGMFLGVKLELKTEDAKGRAVGKLHGKQKNYAEKEGWFIARNTREVEMILSKIEYVSDEIKDKVESMMHSELTEDIVDMYQSARRCIK